MEFTPKQKNAVKDMLRSLIGEKDKQSGGHCGFHLSELNPLLEEMQQEGTIKIRQTLHNDQCFLNK